MCVSHRQLRSGVVFRMEVDAVAALAELLEQQDGNYSVVAIAQQQQQQQRKQQDGAALLSSSVVFTNTPAVGATLKPMGTVKQSGGFGGFYGPPPSAIADAKAPSSSSVKPTGGFDYGAMAVDPTTKLTVPIGGSIFFEECAVCSFRNKTRVLACAACGHRCPRGLPPPLPHPNTNETKIYRSSETDLF